MSRVTMVFRWFALGVLSVVVISYIVFGMGLMRSVNVFDALQADHDTMRSLFSRVESDQELFAELKRHLEAHHKSEGTIVYNALRQQEGFKDTALMAMEEHHLIELLLRDLDGLSRKDERWPARLAVLREYTEHHFKEEEEVIFPEARNRLDEEQMHAMGKQLKREMRMLLWRGQVQQIT